MKIIPDSNIYCADYHMTGSDFKTLFAGLYALDHRLCVLAIVLDEVVGSFRRQLESVRDRASKLRSDYRRLSASDLVTSISDDDIERMTTEFSTTMRTRLAVFPTDFVPYPEISHESVVSRAIDRKRPFSEKGSGYRDTLIWDSVVREARDGHVVAFITADTKAFAGSGNELHADLNAELAALGIDSGRVLLYNSLKHFVDEHITPHLDTVAAEIRAQIEAGEYAGLDLHDEISVLMAESAGSVEWPPSLLGFPGEVETATISSVDELSNFQVTGIHRLSPGEFLVDMEADAWIDFELFIFKGDFWVMSEEEMASISVSDLDWNKHYIAASGTREVHAELRMIFDAGLRQITSLEIDELYALEPQHGEE